MRKSRTDTTTIQVDLALFATREDHPTAEGIVALLVDQARVEDPVEAVALSGEMTMEVAARRIADAQFFDDGGMTESTLLQILYGFGMSVQLQPIEDGRGFQQIVRFSRRDLLLEVSDTLAEREAL